MAYRKYNWPQIFEWFEHSGKSQSEFCKQHDINPKYFSLKLSKNRREIAPAFSQIVVAPEPVSTAGLTLEVGDCKIHCPQSMSTDSFATLVKSLA